MGDDGVAHMESDLQWLRYVQATTINHEFTVDWGRRMEEILVLVGSLRMEGSSSEEREQKENRSETRTLKVEKPTEAIKTSPQKQCELRLKLVTKKMSSSNKEP